VEHIYPQNPAAADRWKDHDLWIDRLGNLTLLAKRLNEKIRNEKFSVKKPEYEKSDLELTKQLLKYDDWNTANVNHRQEWNVRLRQGYLEGHLRFEVIALATPKRNQFSQIEDQRLLVPEFVCCDKQGGVPKTPAAKILAPGNEFSSGCGELQRRVSVPSGS